MEREVNAASLVCGNGRSARRRLASVSWLWQEALRRVRIVLEAVPNLSEGRNPDVIAAIGGAFASDATLLDVHSDADHHRSVFTLVAGDRGLVESLLAGIREAVERIDLREHTGVHPRVGAADVVPLVPLVPDVMDRASEAARSLAARIGAELELPVFLYGEVGGGRRPAFFRRGGLDALRRRVEGGELSPDAGPRTIDPRSGVLLVGARHVLVAYNLDLATEDVEVARAVAAAVRESSGGMVGVQAIGLRLPGSRRTQVSMNVIDVDAAPLHAVVERVRAEARARSTDVVAGELVGLLPERVLDAAVAAGVELPGVDESQILERRLASRLAE
jgi:glutamate formiminotransferase